MPQMQPNHQPWPRREHLLCVLEDVRVRGGGGKVPFGVVHHNLGNPDVEGLDTSKACWAALDELEKEGLLVRKCYLGCTETGCEDVEMEWNGDPEAEVFCRVCDCSITVEEATVSTHFWFADAGKSLTSVAQAKPVLDEEPLTCSRADCTEYPTHQAYCLGTSNSEVFLCQKHANDPETEGWYLEPPSPLLVPLRHVEGLLEDAKAELESTQISLNSAKAQEEYARNVTELFGEELSLIHKQAVFISEEFIVGTNQRGQEGKYVYNVHAPGGLILGREDGLDDTPFEWSRDLSRGLGFTHRARAEHAAKKAPDWWASKAWEEVRAEHAAKS